MYTSTYGVYGHSIFSDIFPVIVPIAIALYVAILAVSLSLILDAASEKDHDDMRFQLCFLGIVCTPILPAVIVAAFPENNKTKYDVSKENELPSV